LKEVKNDKGAKEEIAALNNWLVLNTTGSELKKQIKEQEAALDALALKQYPKLAEKDIKTLVVDNKWLAELDKRIHGEMDRISQALTQRVKELAERYEAPLPQLTDKVAELEEKVNAHLQRMGFSWQ
jgi:type I restriction enzyme M protein